MYGDSTCGQRAIYQLGQTGIPVYNVNNNCSTGSTALMLAYQAVGSGVSECVLALGFEKMERGSLTNKYADRTNPLDQHMSVMTEVQGVAEAPFPAQMFGGAGREHMQKYGTTARAARQDRRQEPSPRGRQRTFAVPPAPARWRRSWPRRMVFEPLTKFQCCPTTDGAAAAVVCSREFARRHGLERPVTIAAMSLKTDFTSSFAPRSMIKMVGQDMSRAAADEVYQQSGIGPEDVDVIELHDCFTQQRAHHLRGARACVARAKRAS